MTNSTRGGALTSQSQGQGRGLYVLGRDRSTGVGSGVLLLEAVDDHPLLVGSQVQPISEENIIV